MRNELFLDNLFCTLEITEEKNYDNAAEEIRAELRSEMRGLVGWSKARDRGLPATLSRRECKALMSAYKKGKFAERNNLVIKVLYSTGMRIEELEELKFCDVFFDNQTVFIRSGKGNKDRYCCIDTDTLKELKVWQIEEKKEVGDSVFGLSKRQLRRVIEKAGEITGVSKKYDAMGRVFSCHSLRHAFATHSYENGIRVPTLRMLLGHEHLGTTMIYLYTAKKYDVIEYNRTNPIQNIIPHAPKEDMGEDIPPDLEKVPLNEYHKEIYEAKMRYLRDEYSMLQIARKKGIEEGRDRKSVV